MKQDLKRHSDPALAAYGNRRLMKDSDLMPPSQCFRHGSLVKMLMMTGSALTAPAYQKGLSRDPGITPQQKDDMGDDVVKITTCSFWGIPVRKARELDPEAEPYDPEPQI